MNVTQDYDLPAHYIYIYIYILVGVPDLLYFPKGMRLQAISHVYSIDFVIR